MIWGKTDSQRWHKRKNLEEWHDYFCWHPILLNDGRFAWFETVERRFVYSEYICWEYRIKTEEQ